jgi:hypothetical protein
VCDNKSSFNANCNCLMLLDKLLIHTRILSYNLIPAIYTFLVHCKINNCSIYDHTQSFLWITESPGPLENGLYVPQQSAKKKDSSITVNMPCIINTYVHGFYYSCSSNGTPHTNLLIMKGHFKNLYWINTAQTPIVLSTDIPTQVKPRFISKKSKCWVQTNIMFCLQKPATKMCSSFRITFFNYVNLCYFIWMYVLKF